MDPRGSQLEVGIEAGVSYVAPIMHPAPVVPVAHTDAFHDISPNTLVLCMFLGDQGTRESSVVGERASREALDSRIHCGRRPWRWRDLRTRHTPL